MAVQRFSFRFDPRFVPLLAGMGVVRRTSGIVVDAHRLDVRFGLLRVTTPIGNIEDVRITRGYRWFKAIGARLSFTDRGVTFGTNTEVGVCVCFREPVSALFGDLLTHPGLTVTISEPEALVAALWERMESS